MLLSTQYNGRVDLRLNLMGNPLLFIISGLCGISIVFLLSHKLNSSVLKIIGKYSIIFFPMEAYVRNIVNAVINRCCDTNYIPMIDLPYFYALIELPIILICLILIIKYIRKPYGLIINQSHSFLLKLFNS